MSDKRIKNGFKWLLEGGYNLGHSITSQFSDSRVTGIVDAGLGLLTSTWAVGSALAVVGNLSLAAAAITAAPVTAATAVGMAVLCAAITCIAGGNAVGFFKAAQEKAGLPDPSPVAKKIQKQVSNNVSTVSNIFKTGATKLSAPFAKAVHGIKGKPAAKPKPAINKNFKF
jgi:hypothetical protein